MELDLISFAYLFLRLAPFVLVCFFSLTSVLNQDFKGIVYLVGLLLSCSIVYTCDNWSAFKRPATIEKQPDFCSMFTIGSNEAFKNLPISQTTFGYTFNYLFYFIIKNKSYAQNIATLIFFPILIIADLCWNWNPQNKCYLPRQSIAAFCIAGVIGFAWAAFIDSTKNPDIAYFPGMSNAEICSRPSKQTFKCNVYKNGNIISSKMTG